MQLKSQSCSRQTSPACEILRGMPTLTATRNLERRLKSPYLAEGLLVIFCPFLAILVIFDHFRSFLAPHFPSFVFFRVFSDGILARRRGPCTIGHPRIVLRQGVCPQCAVKNIPFWEHFQPASCTLSTSFYTPRFARGLDSNHFGIIFGGCFGIIFGVCFGSIFDVNLHTF